MKKISKAVREEAIEHLLCSADSYGAHGDDYARPCRSESAGALVNEALAAVWDTSHSFGIARDCAEAAGLLLDSWLPGDLVTLRMGGVE